MLKIILWQRFYYKNIKLSNQKNVKSTLNMKVKCSIVIIFSLISVSTGVGYKISKIDKCIGNDKQISVEKCYVIDDYLLNLRINFLVGIDYSIVRK